MMISLPRWLRHYSGVHWQPYSQEFAHARSDLCSAQPTTSLIPVWQLTAYTALFARRRRMHPRHVPQKPWTCSANSYTLLSTARLSPHFTLFHQQISTMTKFTAPKILILVMVAGLASSLPTRPLAARSNDFDGLFAIW